MHRHIFVNAALLCALIACGPARPVTNPKDAGTGCIGASCGDAGSPDASVDGPTPVALSQVRAQTFYTRVKIENVVVHTVESSFVGNPLPDGGSARCTGKAGAEFWVVDPTNPSVGISVEKDCEDLPTDYEPAVGDVITIDGYFQIRSSFDNPNGYRAVLRNEFNKKCGGDPCPGKLQLTKTGSADVPPPNQADSRLGSTDGGRASATFAGTRVHVPGPVTLTNPRPLAMKRVSAVQGDDQYYGFEVTGGVLVSNYKTFGTTRDGGPERCDWRAEAIDGGAVTFPNGITGVWDTYTFAGCTDGGTDINNCFNNKGSVPGTGLTNTFALYPQTCADFDGGTVTR